MSDEKNIDSKNPSADDLTKTKNPGDVQLNEVELSDVSGGGTPTLDVLKLKPW
jgi:hypothetical protein